MTIESDLLAARTIAPFLRFESLPLPRVLAALTTVFRVHDRLEAAGWCAGDFYDGCLIYDFIDHALYLLDLDHYQSGPYRNHMGRMFGSDRFPSVRALRTAWEHAVVTSAKSC